MDHSIVELCGCRLSVDGKVITPCPDCRLAALRERTEGALPPPPSFMQRLLAAFASLPRCL